MVVSSSVSGRILLGICLGLVSLVLLGPRTLSLGYRLAARDFRGDLIWLGLGSIWLPLLMSGGWGATPLERGVQGLAASLIGVILERCLSWPYRQQQAGDPLLRLGRPPSAWIRRSSGGVLLLWGALVFRHVHQDPWAQTYLLALLGLSAGLYLVFSGVNDRILTPLGVCDFTGTVYWTDVADYTWSESMKTWQWWWLPPAEYQCLILKLKTDPVLGKTGSVLATASFYIANEAYEEVQAVLSQYGPRPDQPLF